MKYSLPPDRLMALTLDQPWAYVVAAGMKRVENRSWRPPKKLIGRPLVIHAGQRYDRVAENRILAERSAVPFFDSSEARIKGRIIAVATVEGYVEDGGGNLWSETAHSRVESWLPGQGIWFFGPFGWLLKDIVRLPPHLRLEVRGFQRVWGVPPHVDQLLKGYLNELG